MDFALPPEIEALRRRIADFVAAEILPLEADRPNYDEHENIAAAGAGAPARARSRRRGSGRRRCRARWAASG